MSAVMQTKIAVEAEQANAKKRLSAVQPEILTTGWLKGFIRDISEVGPSKDEENRMSRLFAMFKASGTETVSDATKGLAEGLKRGEEGYSYAHKCASEIRTLYGAFRYVNGFQPRGYKASVEAARTALKEMHLDWKGGHVRTADEKKRDDAVRVDVAVFEAERKAFHDAANRGLDPEAVEQAATSARDTAIRELGKAKAVKLAERLCEKYPPDFIEQLIECLMDRASGYGPVKTTDKLAQAE